MAVRFSCCHRAPFRVVAWLALLCCAAGCAEGQSLAPPEPTCGDGIVQNAEVCDNGLENSDTSPDACRMSCRPAACGDGVVDTGEECDDHNAESGDGCSASCHREFVCGDHQCEAERGESCSLCAQDCCVCGDGECTSAFGETCSMCPSECCPACGDGVLDDGEACDDGNNTPGDGCGAGCDDEDGAPTCGNGFLEAGEACDDGNTAARDGCSPSCAVEFTCGDGVCAAESGETCQRCQPDCCPLCGNGVIDADEACDGAALNDLTCTGACYDGGALGCTAWCTYDYSACTGDLPTCGDGVAECTEACDGDDFLGSSCEALGFASGSLTCTACAVDTSSCGPVAVFLREEFDTACPPPGWTLGGDWECGTPRTVGPAAAHSGAACIATQIDANYSPNQTYDVAIVTTPPIDLTTAEEPVLGYWAWLNTEGTSSGAYDGYNVKISTNGGATYTQLTDVLPEYNLTIAGQSAWGGDQSSLGWHIVNANLAPYIGNTVRLRFAFRSDSSIQYPGVYIDDVWVFERAIIPLAISTPAPLASAFTQIPYTAALARTGGSSRAIWRITGGTNHAWLSIDPSTGQLTGTPALANVGPVSVTVRVEEPLVPTNFSEQTFNLTVVRAVYQTSFEGACPAGWTLAGDWECGAPITVGPPAAFAGTQCLGTQIDANYSVNQTYAATTATSPAIDLAGLTTASLSFRMWLNTERSYDGANLKISVNGGAFTTLTGLSPGYDSNIDGQAAWNGDESGLGWQLVTANLSAFVGQSIRLQFAFRSDTTRAFPGVYIDDVRVLP